MARFIAFLVLAASLAGIAYISRDRWLPQEEALEGTGNPVLDACLADRVGAVDKMRADGIINDSQYQQFRARAVTLCENTSG